MKCIEPDCNAPVISVARIKNGPGDWDLLPNVCACAAHRGSDEKIGSIDEYIKSQDGLKDKTIQIIPVPTHAQALDPKAIADIVKEKNKDKGRSAEALAVEKKMARLAAKAALRMAGFKES